MAHQKAERDTHSSGTLLAFICPRLLSPSPLPQSHWRNTSLKTSLWAGVEKSGDTIHIIYTVDQIIYMYSAYTLTDGFELYV